MLLDKDMEQNVTLAPFNSIDISMIKYRKIQVCHLEECVCLCVSKIGKRYE